MFRRHVGRGEGCAETFEYIEAYYNTQRKHSSLGYLTPAQFEARIQSLN